MNIKKMTQAAIIAALYVVLTYLAGMLGLASGAIQIRFSEALTILPVFTPAAIPGLFAGCILSNLFTGCALPDIVFGSLATLIGAVFTRKLRKLPYLAPVPPNVTNTMIVQNVLLYAYGIKPSWLSFLTVFAGEMISCEILGILLEKVIKKRAARIFE